MNYLRIECCLSAVQHIRNRTIVHIFDSGAKNFRSEMAFLRLAVLCLMILINDLRTYICLNMHARSAQTQSSGIDISSIHSLALNRAAVVLPNSIMVIGSCMRVTSFSYLSIILIVLDESRYDVLIVNYFSQRYDRRQVRALQSAIFFYTSLLSYSTEQRGKIKNSVALLSLG